MIIDVPMLFMQNNDWWTRDSETDEIILTDKAPQEAIDNYNKFMKAYRKAEAKSVEIIKR